MNFKHRTILFLSCIALLSCSGSQKKESNTLKEESSVQPPKEIQQAVVELTVKAVGETMMEIAFEPKILSIPANSMVKLLFKNESSSAGMLHNFVLVELGSGQEIATKGIKAGKEKQFVPNDQRVIMYTKVLDMGEETIVEFKAPSKGSYHFICTFPGHFPNMIGRFNVE